jgi:hypothetical protein
MLVKHEVEDHVHAVAGRAEILVDLIVFYIGLRQHHGFRPAPGEEVA